MLKLKKTEIEIKDKVATVWLNQPEKRNALNPGLIEDIIQAFKSISREKEILVILLRARGSSFCAGADLTWMLNSGSRKYSKSLNDSRKLTSCFKTIYNTDKIVINLIHGDLFGGGVGFTGAADFTFAMRNTKFCLPEMKLGLIPSVIMPYLLSRVSIADVRYKIFSGIVFTAEDALNMGLIDFVCEDLSEMETKVNDLIKQINVTSPKTIKEMKQLFRYYNTNLINEQSVKKTSVILTRLKSSAEAQSRMSEFILNKKIKPRKQEN